MAQKSIGPSFAEELGAVGGLLGHHFSWDESGNLFFFEDTPDVVIAGVKSVYAAHDPSKPSWASRQAAARAALDDSDTSIMRCYENAVPVPAAWVDYRKSLRAIVSASSGDSLLELPAKPPYPSGT